MDNLNPNPMKSTIAMHFIHALATIHQTTTTNFSSSSSSIARSRRIKRAAYASMAMAAGPRRAWSRAMLRRVHGRHCLGFQRRIRVSRFHRLGGATSQVESLRRVVPGGESMNLRCLLEETASYLGCLRDQVILMQSIADSASLI